MNNYAINAAPFAATSAGVITVKSLTSLSLTAAQRVYDQTTAGTLDNAQAALYAAGEYIGDSLILGGVSVAFDNKNVGTGKVVTASGAATLGGADMNNYAINATPYAATSAGVITVKSLSTLGLTVGNKVYNQTTVGTIDNAQAALTTAGEFGGDNLTLNSVNAAFSDKNVGSGKSVALSGTGTLSGTDSLNYVLDGTAQYNASTTADISPLGISILSGSIDADSKTYDANTTATISGSGVLVGVISGDAVVLNQNLQSGNFDSKNVEISKLVYVNGLSLSGRDAGNYLLQSGYTTTANIYKLGISIASGTITAASKVYDDTTSAAVSGSGYLIGVLSGDRVLLNQADKSGSFDNKNAGVAKSVSVSGLTLYGTDALDYYLTDYTATANITPKALSTLQLTVASKVYDSTDVASLNNASAAFVSAGAYPGDTLSLLNVSAAFDSKNVGAHKQVTLFGQGVLGGLDANNYLLASLQYVPLTYANISPANLVVSASGVSRAYNATSSATVNLTDNHYSGDDLVDSYSNADFVDKGVGLGKAVSVVGISISGADAANYICNTTASTVADITSAQLTITASGINRQYNGNTNASVVLGDDRFAGDIFTDIYASALFATPNIGNGIPITVTGITISGQDATNYVYNTTAETAADIKAIQSTPEEQKAEAARQASINAAQNAANSASQGTTQKQDSNQPNSSTGGVNSTAPNAGSSTGNSSGNSPSGSSMAGGLVTTTGNAGNQPNTNNGAQVDTGSKTSGAAISNANGQLSMTDGEGATGNAAEHGNAKTTDNTGLSSANGAAVAKDSVITATTVGQGNQIVAATSVTATITMPQPENAVDYLARGNAYANNGDYGNAISDYTAAIKDNPRLGEAYLNLGIVEYKNNVKVEALANIKIALNLDITLAKRLSPDIIKQLPTTVQARIANLK